MDQCRLTPELPGCQAIAPPSVSEPVKPVQQATNEVILAVNRDQQQLADARNQDGDTQGSSGGATRPDDDKQVAGGNAGTEPGTQDGKPVIKNYCN